MSKSSAPKNANKTASKTPAANSTKDNMGTMPAEDNDSKYQPTEDADMNAQSLDSEDAVMKLFTDSIKDIYWAEND